MSFTSDVALQTGWQPFKRLIDANLVGSTLLGNKFVDQSNANFVGKVSGSTTANPHIAKRTLVVAFRVQLNAHAPNSGLFGAEASYSDITALDNTSWGTSNSSSG